MAGLRCPPTACTLRLGAALGLAGGVAVGAACSLVLPGEDEFLGGSSVSSVPPGASSSSGTAGGGTGSGGDGGGAGAGCSLPGCGVNLDPNDAGVDYVIYRAKGTPDPTSPTCADMEGAPRIPFLGYCDDFGPKFSCRLLWGEASGNSLVFGCCEVCDAALFASQTPPDGGEVASWWRDDAFEYVAAKETDPDVLPNATTTKTAITILGYHYDAHYPNGSPDGGFDGGVVVSVDLDGGAVNDERPDHGYVLKWRTRLAFPAAPAPDAGQKIRCHAALFDARTTSQPPEGTPSAYMKAKADENVNFPEFWATCLLADSYSQ